MKGFIKDCLLFQSKDKTHWALGILTWVNLFQIILSVIKLFIALQK